MTHPIRIVLVNTSHPGNIGAAARAMKTMALRDLTLVKPKKFPSAQAVERAAGADDILSNAVVTEDLASAVNDCHLVIGASARSRDVSLPVLSPEDCAKQLRAEAQNGPVALVFGNEQWGLSNEELSYCQAQTTIATDESYHSLNLAAAVQVYSYELMKQTQAHDAPLIQTEEPATNAEIEGFYEHLTTTLTNLQFLNPDQPKQLLYRLRRLFSRARLEEREVNILRGILSSVDRQIKT